MERLKDKRLQNSHLLSSRSGKLSQNLTPGLSSLPAPTASDTISKEERLKQLKREMRQIQQEKQDVAKKLKTTAMTSAVRRPTKQKVEKEKESSLLMGSTLGGAENRSSHLQSNLQSSLLRSGSGLSTRSSAQSAQTSTLQSSLLSSNLGSSRLGSNLGSSSLGSNLGSSQLKSTLGSTFGSNLRSNLGSSSLSSNLGQKSTLGGQTGSSALKGNLELKYSGSRIGSGSHSANLSSRLLTGSGLGGASTEGKLNLAMSSNLQLTSSSLQTSSLLSSSLQTSSLVSPAQPAKPKAKPVKRKGAQVEGAEHKKYMSDQCEFPTYDLPSDGSDSGVEMMDFTGPGSEGEEEELRMDRPMVDLHALKRAFVNAVSGSLLRAPDFKDKSDATRQGMLSLATQMASYEPEFVLKVALYTRQDLNIRTTANFLLAFSSFERACRPYLRTYFGAAVRLPSDWIDVAEQFTVFSDRSLAAGALPAMLRRVMAAKFPDFDKYQLGKYNKDSSGKKKKKKEKEEDGDGGRGGRGRGRGRGVRGGRPPRGGRGGRFIPEEHQIEASASSSEGESEEEEDDGEDRVAKVKRMVSALSEVSETEEENARRSFTLKQLIRKLHITEPVEHVMCLVGKKYPETSEEFYLSRLPGTFEEERVGKRMKLPTPETWETQVSLKGNKAKTWEDLIDHKKLPFMAMLRNLRNMIKAGISQKHHTWVLKKLQDEGAVTNSRQFPFRFFSAYEVLSELEKEFEENQQALIDAAVGSANQDTAPPMVRGGRGGGRGRGGRGRGGRGGRGGRTPKEPKPIKEAEYDPQMLARYKRALDTSVKIATCYNVTPIRGRTLIYVNQSNKLKRPCSSARGLGKPRTIAEIGLLLGLMCKYSCEESELYVYGPAACRAVQLEKGTILDNMASTQQLDMVINNPSAQGEGDLPAQRLEEILRDRIQVDNFMILSDGVNDKEGAVIANFLEKYRLTVNPDLLFVSVDLSGRVCGVESSRVASHPNDVYISGYSDALLRFVAERGDASQLTYIDNIATKYNLPPTQPALGAVPGTGQGARGNQGVERPLPMVQKMPRWRSARIFVSSPFRDFHGERDVVVRHLVPELRRRAASHFISVTATDLRWGVTEQDTKLNRALELCLSEVARSQFFVGMLGERYGWQPDDYTVSDPQDERFAWLRDCPPGLSVTELEFLAGALRQPHKASGRAFFFLRNADFISQVPKKLREDFEAESADTARRMASLKQCVQHSGHEVFAHYPCRWGGVVEGKPTVAGLEQFAVRALDNLWTGIRKCYPDEDIFVDELSHLTALHEAALAQHSEGFVGRGKLLRECTNTLRQHPTGIILLTGKPGAGKTALMASLYRQVLRGCGQEVAGLCHVVGAVPASTSAAAIMARLTAELTRRFSLTETPPQDYTGLVEKFPEILGSAAACLSCPLVVFIDGLDLLDNTDQARTLTWIPTQMPKNVLLVLSARENTDVHKSAQRLPLAATLRVGDLDLLDKATVARQTLQQHRKKLDESPFNNQMKLLTGKKEAVSPLYLQVACDELSMFGVFEQVGAKLKSLPQSLPLLLQAVLSRLEEEHGAQRVSSAMVLLACVRQGLGEVDLCELLSQQEGTVLPPVVFARLLTGIRGLLKPTAADTTLSLCNKEVATAVHTRYMKGSAADLHSLLATYFLRCADPAGDGSWAGKHQMAVAELPYHLACCGNYTKLESILCDLHFIYVKCRLGLAMQLLEDYQPVAPVMRTMQRSYAKFQSSARVAEFRAFVASNVHILARHPALTWQQAANAAGTEAGAVRRAAREVDVRQWGLEDMVPLIWCNKPRGRDECVLTVPQVGQVVRCVAVSGDGSYVACGGDDCVIRLLRLDTGKEVKTFTGHASSITAVCFVGKDQLCSASADTTLSVWSISSGHREHILKGHTRKVTSCTANASARNIVSVGLDCSIKVWDGRNGKLEYNLYGETRPVNCVTFHPEGQLIAVASWDGAIRVWDIFHKKRKAVLRGHRASVRSVAYSPSGRHLASASLDGAVMLWSARNGSPLADILGHTLPINALAFSQGALVTAADDHKVKVWSGHLGKQLQCMALEEGGESEADMPATCVVFHPSGEEVTAGYHEGQVLTYDVFSGVRIRSQPIALKARVSAIAYDPTGDAMIWGVGAVTYLYATSGPMSRPRPRTKGRETGGAQTLGSEHGAAVTALKFGRGWGVTAAADGVVHVYEARAWAARSTPAVTMHHHSADVTGIDFNTDETRMVTVGRDRKLCVYELGLSTMSQPLRQMLDCHSDWINGCAWSDISDHIVTCSNDFNLKLWSADTLEEKVTFTGHQSAVTSVAFKQGCIVSTSCDGSAKVWSQKGSEITTLQAHKGMVNAADIHVKMSDAGQTEDEDEETGDWAVAVTEEEHREQHERRRLEKRRARLGDVYVVTAADDATIRVWRPLVGNELRCLTGHSDKVASVAVASSRGDIVTSSLDHTLKTWLPVDAERGEEAGEEVEGHEGEVTALEASGQWLFSGSRDGVVKVFQYKTAATKIPQQVASFQAHDKAVTGICMYSSQHFATVSLDGKARSWLMTPQRTAAIMAIRRVCEVCEVDGGSPLTSVQCLSPPHQQPPLLAGTSWAGNVWMWDTATTTAAKVCGDWLLCSSVVRHGTTVTMATGDLAGNLSTCTWEAAALRHKLKELSTHMQQRKIAVVPALKQVAGEQQPRGQQQQWLTSMAAAAAAAPTGEGAQRKNLVYASDVRGNVYRVNLSAAARNSGTVEGVTAAHSKSAITCLAVARCDGRGQGGGEGRCDGRGRRADGDSEGSYLLFTAARDNTVKVWSEPRGKQIGQYFCTSPVTKMVAMDNQTVVMGNQLGQLHFFSLPNAE